MSIISFFKTSRLIVTSASIILLLAACGGGGSSSDNAADVADNQTTENTNNPPTESRYKAIAGEWKGTWTHEVGDNTFKFTIDLNGVGLRDGELLYVDEYRPGEFIRLKTHCNEGGTKCRRLLFGKINAEGTKITDGANDGFSADYFTAVKVRSFGS